MMSSHVTVLPDGLPGRTPFDPTLQLAQVVQLLRRNLWLIGLCGILAGVAAVAYVHTLPKTFTANGLLAIQGDQLAIPQLRGALRGETLPDPMPVIHTEVQALASRALVAQVAAQLHLAADPEFNAALRPPTLMARLNGLVARLLPPAPAPAGAAAPPSDEPVVDAAERALSIFQDNRSLVISIGFTARDPALAARFVNTLIKSYIATRASRRGAADAGANTALVQRVAEARAGLNDIEQQMNALRSKDQMVGVRAGSIGQQQVGELATAAARATLERTQLEVSYNRALAARKSGSSDALAAVLSSATIAQLREQAAAASQRIAQFSAHYGPNYPGMRAARAQLGAAQSQIHAETARIIDSLGAQLQVARDQEASVIGQLAVARRRAVTAENANAKLDQLKQEAVTRRALYQTLLESEQQTVAQPVGSTTPDVRVLSAAVPPAGASGPNLKIAGLMGGSGGLLLGCLLALTRLATVRGVDTAEELSRTAGVPVLATLPRRMLRSGAGLLAAHPSAAAAHGPDADAMHALYDRLRFTGRTGVPRCVLFLPDAATSLAASLAGCFARAAATSGQRVLLIEADLQGAPLAAQLGIRLSRTSETGIRPVLAGEDWQDAATQDLVPGLDLLLAIAQPEQRHRLDGVPLQNLLIEARSEYDIIVLNGPVPEAAETAALVQRADVAVLVIDGRRDRGVTHRASSHLAQLTLTPLVAVLVQKS